VVAGRGDAARTGHGEAAVTGGAVLKAASAGATRRLTQTALIFVVLTMATTAALVGLVMASNPTEAFHAVSARYHTAQLALTIDAGKVSSAQLARTRGLPGVTGAVGYPATTVDVTIPATPGYEGDVPITGPLTVVGRASRSGPLDEITQKSGHWPTRLGEIDQNDLSGTRGSVGQLTTITVTGLAGKPKLAIVGWGSLPSQDLTQNAWALPGEITALVKAGAPRQEQMLYTFRHAATAAQAIADLAELRAALPAGAIVSHAVALDGQQQVGNGIHSSSTVPYAVMALLLAAVIVASLAAAAVTAGYRRIGVLKSIGFTPAQIAVSYLGQLGVPALAGALAGTVLGNRWVLPLIQVRSLFKVSVAVPVWITVTVPAGMLALTGLAALLPAVRTGRRPAVQVITAGQAPRARHGQAAQRLAGRLPLPRPVTAGLAAPFARPTRSAATFATITVGLTATVLAVGLSTQITKVVIVIGTAYIDRTLFQKLTWLVVVLAAVGVFATLLTQARERVRDLGIHKALGMTPRQVITMVTCWAIAPAIIAAIIALPAGAALEPVIARAIVTAQAGPLESGAPLDPGPQPGPPTVGRPGNGAPSQKQRPAGTQRREVRRPQQHRMQGTLHGVQGIFGHLFRIADQDPYTPAEFALLTLAGLVIALAGALGPAVWAATTKTTTVLHAE
jgi:FtsX-like permease family